LHSCRTRQRDHPHRLGFPFEKCQVDHSRKGTQSRLPGFAYEHEHRFTEHKHGKIRCEATNGGDHPCRREKTMIQISGRTATCVHHMVNRCELQLHASIDSTYPQEVTRVGIWKTTILYCVDYVMRPSLNMFIVSYSTHKLYWQDDVFVLGIRYSKRFPPVFFDRPPLPLKTCHDMPRP